MTAFSLLHIMFVRFDPPAVMYLEGLMGSYDSYLVSEMSSQMVKSYVI
jgi:hypothetical protein